MNSGWRQPGTLEAIVAVVFSSGGRGAGLFTGQKAKSPQARAFCSLAHGTVRQGQGDTA